MRWARAARFRQQPEKANLFATFRDGPGGIILSGHLDVVPVDGQEWLSDPFKLVVKDGRAYGRGTCDMKGFDAVILGQAKSFGQARLSQPIYVALTYDEEPGCIGVRELIAALDRWNIHPVDDAMMRDTTRLNAAPMMHCCDSSAAIVAVLSIVSPPQRRLSMPGSRPTRTSGTVTSEPKAHGRSSLPEIVYLAIV